MSQYIYPIPHTLLSRLGRTAPRKSSLLLALLLALLLFPLLAAAQPNKFLIGTDKGLVGFATLSLDGDLNTEIDDTAVTGTAEASATAIGGEFYWADMLYISIISLRNAVLFTAPEGYSYPNNQPSQKICSRSTLLTAALSFGRVNLIQGSGRQTQWGLSNDDSETETLESATRECSSASYRTEDATSDNSQELTVSFAQGVGNGVVVGFDLDDDLDEGDHDYGFSISKGLNQSLVLRGGYGLGKVEADEDSVGYSSKDYNLELLISGNENVLMRVAFLSGDTSYNDGDSLATSGFVLGIEYVF